MVNEKGRIFKSPRGEKISKALTGKKLSPEHIDKIRQNNILGIIGMKGKKHSDDTKKKISLTLSGKNHHNWSGGVSKVYKHIRCLAKYKEWRNLILNRDNFTCVFCGNKQGWNKELKKRFCFEVDHIIPLCSIVNKYSITNSQQAVLCEELWDISNGRSLCKECHKTTDTYKKSLKQQNKYE